MKKRNSTFNRVSMGLVFLFLYAPIFLLIIFSFNSGKTAVEAAIAGETGKMVGFKCDRENGYKCEYVLFDLEKVANFEQKVPLEWITEDKSNVTADFIKYCAPLIAGELVMPMENGLPRFAKLKKVFAE